MAKDHGFRGLYYFRHGWGNYAAFIVSALSTLTITYFLAIENFSPLQTIFPTFTHYALIIGSIAIPILATVGYVHWKKSNAMKAEIDISYEVNPYITRIIVDSDLILKLNLKLEKILEFTEKGKISKEELDELKKLNKELNEFISKRKFRSKDDWNYFNNEIK